LEAAELQQEGELLRDAVAVVPGAPRQDAERQPVEAAEE